LLQRRQRFAEKSQKSALKDEQVVQLEEFLAANVQLGLPCLLKTELKEVWLALSVIEGARCWRHWCCIELEIQLEPPAALPEGFADACAAS
jgi:hypothetical protein